jgi:hypothetical protein
MGRLEERKVVEYYETVNLLGKLRHVSLELSHCLGATPTVSKTFKIRQLIETAGNEIDALRRELLHEVKRLGEWVDHESGMKKKGDVR